MRILVTGSNGQLGKALQRQSKSIDGIDWIFTDVEQLNITDAHAVLKALKDVDVCINCAAYTAVDNAENDAGTAYMINDEAVGNLVKASLAHNTFLVHISTDYVFDGSSSTPYKNYRSLQAPRRLWSL